MRKTLFVIGATLATTLLASNFALSQSQYKGSLSPTAVVTPHAIPAGNTPGGPELDPATSGGDADSGGDGAPFQGVAVNRTIAKKHGVGVKGNSGAHFKSNPTLSLSFNALNLFEQRYANGGNQLTLEPPDQGLCAGNGYVLETVNDVLQISDTNGNQLTPAIALNAFYGYAPAYNRATAKYGPEITDPSCYYDHDTQRFYHLVLTLDRYHQTSGLTGQNHLDLAVSDTSNPLGSWTIYSLDTTDDGLNGTPNHGCYLGPCFGDYPHIGADAYGIYLTTNEFELVSGYYHGSQIYAMSKRALAAGGPVTYVQFDTANPAFGFEGHPGFTVWPAISAANQADRSAQGTEYFLSDLANWSDSGLDQRVQQWTMTNTASLDSPTPNPSLTYGIVNTLPYGEPPYVAQQAGNYPLGQFLHDPEGPINPNDTRMQQVYYANGKLWSGNVTGIIFDGDPNLYSGIAYYVINPNSLKTMSNGYIAVPGNSVMYPATAANASGRGIVAFTLVGQNFFPSAAYASLDAVAGAGAVQIAASGLGPQDGFSEYAQYSNRPRWGDYGAAALDGNNFWIASEYIGQTCKLSQWIADFTCGGTRAQLGNWGTRVSKLQIQ